MNSLNITHKNGYAIVEMTHGKVNAIDTVLAAALRDAFLELDKNTEVKGAILTARPHCFSAGLDVLGMATGGEVGTKAFWTAYHEMLQALVRFSKPFVCAITGYAPAGATILALCSDYRVMGKGAKHVMGMHEFKVSLMFPEILADIYSYYLGEARAWKAVQKAELYNSDQALALGLVDESVEVEEVLPRAEKHMERLLRIQGKAFVLSKPYFRKGLLEIVNKDIAEKVNVIVENAKDPEMQRIMNAFLASLKR